MKNRVILNSMKNDYPLNVAGRVISKVNSLVTCVGIIVVVSEERRETYPKLASEIRLRNFNLL